MKKLYLIALVSLFIPSVTFGATLNRNLSYGMTGTDVSQLQQFLIDEGLYSSPVTAYFGPMTRSAVIAFQHQEGITPASGYVGAITKADINSILSAHPEWTTTLSNSNSYTNVNSNPVHSPAYSSNGVPAGATAECGDGTYSFSLHHSGSCSHHGGVTQWLQ
jgi:peptidoglycan hydrolase-like protein with peptidoglycan-binding domain